MTATAFFLVHPYPQIKFFQHFPLVLCGCIEQSESEEPEFSFSLLSDFPYAIVYLGWVVSKDESLLLWFNADHWPSLNNGLPSLQVTSHKSCGRLSCSWASSVCCDAVHIYLRCIPGSLILLFGHLWFPPSSWKAWDPNLALDISLSFILA